MLLAHSNIVVFLLFKRKLFINIWNDFSLCSSAPFQSISDDSKPELWIADGFLLDIRKKTFIPAHAYLGSLTSHPCVRPFPTSFLNDLSSRKIPKSMLDISSLEIDIEKSQARLECVTGARGKGSICDRIGSHYSTILETLCSHQVIQNQHLQ